MTISERARAATWRGRLTIAGIAGSVAGVALLLAGVHELGAVLGVGAVAVLSAASPRAAVWSIVLLLPIHPLATRGLSLAGVDGWPFVLASAWKETALAAALASTVISRLIARTGLPDFKRLSAAGDALAVILAALALVAVAVDPGTRSMNGARLLLFPVGLYALVRLNPIEPRRLFLALGLMGASIAAFGIVQSTWLGWSFVENVYGIPGQPIPGVFTAQHLDGPRAAGTFLSPNEFAFAVAAYLCLATVLIVRERSRWRSVLIPVLIVLAVGVAVTFSRSALVGAAIGIGVLGLATLVRRIPLPRATVLALILAFGPATLLTGAIYADRGGLSLLGSTLATITDIGGVSTPSSGPEATPKPGRSPRPSPTPTREPDSSTIGHIGSLGAGWKLVVDHPLGVGLGNVGARPLPGSGAMPGYIVESWYLAMGLSLGWLGLLWAIAFPIVLAVTGTRLLRAGGDVRAALAGIAIAGLAAFVGFLLPTMMEPEVAIVPWLVLAVISNRPREADGTTSASAGPSPSPT